MRDYVIDCQVCGGPVWASYGPACPRCAPVASERSARAVEVLGLVLAVLASALFMLLLVVNVGRWVAS